MSFFQKLFCSHISLYEDKEVSRCNACQQMFLNGKFRTNTSGRFGLIKMSDKEFIAYQQRQYDLCVRLNRDKEHTNKMAEESMAFYSEFKARKK